MKNTRAYELAAKSWADRIEGADRGLAEALGKEIVEIEREVGRAEKRAHRARDEELRMFDLLRQSSEIREQMEIQHKKDRLLS